MSPGSAGVDLVLELVRDAARARRCTSCGRSMAEATAAPGEVDPERIVVHLVCACGADEVVEVRPTDENGHAAIR